MHRVDVQLEDDLTGGPADETIEFSLDGRAYEIDLNTRHASEFRDRLVPFTEHARLVRPQRARVTVRSAASRERSRQIRLWAEQRGFALAPHGRLPGNVIQQYDREQGADRSAEPTRRLAGQRSGSSRQGRKTSTGGRSPRQRGSSRGKLPARVGPSPACQPGQPPARPAANRARRQPGPPPARPAASLPAGWPPRPVLPRWATARSTAGRGARRR